MLGHGQEVGVRSMVGENVTAVWSKARGMLVAARSGAAGRHERSAAPARRGLGAVRGVVKEIEDKALGGLVFVMLLPMMALIALAVAAESSGPILYRQRRSGYGGRQFTCYKFRTMRIDGDRSEFRQAVRNDPRVTRVGRFLRRSSLDELPQLLNVLSGTMSLIGPRPHPRELDRRFAPLIAEYDRRLAVKPGITGLAQVRGYRGETPTLESMRGRIEHDLRYVDAWSPLLDLKILLATPLACLTSENAY